MNLEIFQYEIVWENRQANFDLIESALRASPPVAGSLLVLPEMFSTGFSMNVAEFAEAEDGPSQQFLSRLAQQFAIAVTGSFPHRNDDGGKGLNRMMVFGPQGQELARYDKIHPFTFGQEADHYQGGRRLPIFSFAGWKICPTICYDLRFPEMYRRASLQGGAELFLVIANWPSRRREHWNALLRARAIENQAVVVGLNRVGSDPNVAYSGDSAVIDMLGQELALLPNRVERRALRLDREALLAWRTQFPALRDATEDFELELT